MCWLHKMTIFLVYVPPSSTISLLTVMQAEIPRQKQCGYDAGAPSVTNSVSDGPPDLHNILYQTGQWTMGPCCVYPR
jgi:hypothetical protein